MMVAAAITGGDVTCQCAASSISKRSITKLRESGAV